MQEMIFRLNHLLHQGKSFIQTCPEQGFGLKPSIDKWSKKEILGHLIDSGIKNLQRFTEISYIPKPYKIKHYNQNELVKANNYKDADTIELLNLWISINKRIIYLFKLQNEHTLTYEIELNDGKLADLKFLIEDYVLHTDHHLKQIMKKD